MKQKSFIQSLREKVLRQKNSRARSEDARKWYKELTKNVLRPGNIRDRNDYSDEKILASQAVSARKVMRDTSFVRRESEKIQVGKMYMYQYDAKWKDTLPYWDVFPLSIIVEDKGDRFLVMNLHYIRPDYRLALLDELNEIKNNKRNDNYTKLMLSYETLKRASSSSYYKPCIKWHLKSHIKSSATLIAPKYWDLVCFLRTELFVGASTAKVWSDSEKYFS